MKWSLEVGRPFGIPLRVHVSFLLLVLLFAGMGWQVTSTWRGVALYTLFVLTIFACVVSHELVHSLQARRYGVQVASILLLPIGGIAQMERIPEDPRQELTISIMGPVTNVVIGILVGVPVYLIGGPARLFPPSRETMDPALNFWGAVALTNVGLAVFNLLPAFPMDGGRMLRAALAQHLEYLKATQIARRVTQVCALAMGLSWYWHQNLFVVFIAVMVYLAAGHEERAVRRRTRLRAIPVTHAMVTSFSVVAPSDLLGTVLSHSSRSYQHDFPVVSDGRLAGVVGHEQMVQAWQQRGPNVYVGEIMHRSPPLARPTDNLLDLQERMLASGVSIVPVVEAGHVLGIVTVESLSHYFAAAAQGPLAEGG